MRPTACVQVIVRPTLESMGAHYEGENVNLLMLAVAMQESGLRARRCAHASTPGRGIWCLTETHINRVLNDPVTRDVAIYWCGELIYPFVSYPIFTAIEHNDVLACVFARLLLYLDPKRIPARHDIHGMLEYYMRNWTPTDPHPSSWPSNWGIASLSV